MRLATAARAAALAVVCAVAVGCSNNKGKIEGTKWGNVPTTQDGQQLPANVLTLEFKADGGFVMGIMGIQNLTGKYSLGAGDRVTLTMDQPLEGSKEHVETIKISGDELQMIDSNGKTVKFKKMN